MPIASMDLNQLLSQITSGLQTSPVTPQQVSSMVGANTQAANESYSSLSDTAINTLWGNLDSLMPGWQQTFIAAPQESLAQVNSLSQELMSGQLPEDVQAQIMRSRAELGISQGSFGQANQFATLRDLGLTSLQAQQMGTQMQSQVVNPLTQQLLANASALTNTGINMAQVLQNVTGVSTNMQNNVAQAQSQAATIAGQLASQNAQQQWQTAMQEMENAREDAYIREAQQLSAAQFTLSNVPSYMPQTANSLTPAFNRQPPLNPAWVQARDFLMNLGS